MRADCLVAFVEASHYHVLMGNYAKDLRCRSHLPGHPQNITTTPIAPCPLSSATPQPPPRRPPQSTHTTPSPAPWPSSSSSPPSKASAGPCPSKGGVSRYGSGRGDSGPRALVWWRRVCALWFGGGLGRARGGLGGFVGLGVGGCGCGGVGGGRWGGLTGGLVRWGAF